MLKSVIARLDGDESWRQGPSHSIGRAIIRAAAAIGTGIEVEYVLPGKILKLLHTKRLHLVQMLIANAPSHRLHGPPIQLREVDVEQGGFHVELNSKRPITQQEIKGYLMEKIGAEVEVPECGHGT